MSSQQPASSSPVRVPKAITSYQPSTQDPELRSLINSRLLADGHITKIHESLLHSLHASPTNWPSLIQTHALTLLRSGEVASFPDLLSRVLSDIRADTLALRTGELGITGSTSTTTNGSGSASATTKKEKEKGTGGGSVNGNSNGNGNTNREREGGVSLAVPRQVVEEGLRVTREALEGICDVGE